MAPSRTYSSSCSQVPVPTRVPDDGPVGSLLAAVGVLVPPSEGAALGVAVAADDAPAAGAASGSSPPALTAQSPHPGHQRDRRRGAEGDGPARAGRAVVVGVGQQLGADPGPGRVRQRPLGPRDEFGRVSHRRPPG